MLTQIILERVALPSNRRHRPTDRSAKMGEEDRREGERGREREKQVASGLRASVADAFRPAAPAPMMT